VAARGFSGKEGRDGVKILHFHPLEKRSDAKGVFQFDVVQQNEDGGDIGVEKRGFHLFS
jgi:hypothetical protein